MTYLQDMNPHIPAVAVSPDFTAVNAAGSMTSIIGALLTYGLITAVLMLIVCGTTWAVACHSGSWHTATRAKVGLFVALAGALICGASMAWANWLLGIGAHL